MGIVRTLWQLKIIKTISMRYAMQLCAGVAIILLSGFTTLKWTAYESKDGRYKVTMPGKPEESTQDVETAIGKMTMYMSSFVSEAESDDVKMYMSIYSDYGKDVITSDAKKEFLDNFFKGTISGAAQNVGGEVTKTDVVNYKTYPGRHAIITLKEKNMVMEMQMYLVKDRFYIMQSAYEIGAKNTAPVKQFFNSFQITSVK